MKLLQLLLLFLVYSNSIFANKIDNLKTTEDVESFAKEVYPKFTEFDWAKFKINSTKKIAKKLSCKDIFYSWEIKNWEKTDINNDGLTDLIFMVNWGGLHTYAIIDTGKNKFKTYKLSTIIFGDCELFKPINENGLNYLKIYVEKQEEIGLMEYKTVKLIDTLSFKFNEFVELNHKPADYKIKSIELKTSYCYGSCPVFSLKLDNKGKAIFNGEAYVDFKGKTTKELPIEQFNELKKIINYIRVKELKGKYAVTWTDDQTATLTIIFENNESKTIRDYGLQGTYGLKTIYNKLIEIGTKTKWK